MWIRLGYLPMEPTRMRQLNVALPRDTLQWLAESAKRKNASMAEVVRAELARAAARQRRTKRRARK